MAFDNGDEEIHEFQVALTTGLQECEKYGHSLNSKLFQNPCIPESLFGILKVILQEPGTVFETRKEADK